MANHPSYSEFPFTFEDVKVPTLVQVGTEDPVGPLVITQLENRDVDAAFPDVSRRTSSRGQGQDLPSQKRV